MVASVEMTKLVYLVSRDDVGDLTISSPHEANRKGVICFGIASVEGRISYPSFASLEIDFLSADKEFTELEVQKQMTLYCLDLGMNTCNRRISEPVDNGTSLIMSTPHIEGVVGGVLVCSERFVTLLADDFAEQQRLS